MRKFETGATRDDEDGKFDYEGFYDPLVLQAFASYMHGHRKQPDGTMRSGDNWQRGFPLDVYMKSMLRHVMDMWIIHRGHVAARPEDGKTVTLDEALGGILFNVQGYWSSILKDE